MSSFTYYHSSVGHPRALAEAPKSQSTIHSAATATTAGVKPCVGFWHIIDVIISQPWYAAWCTLLFGDDATLKHLMETLGMTS